MELSDAEKAFQAGLNALLRNHTPSLSEGDDAEISSLIPEVSWGEGDVADLAIRTCSCGTRIDGYYEYIDHLRDKAGLRPKLGSLPGVQEGDVPNG